MSKVTLTLSEIEAKVLAILLERASSEFSNHGCNDFEVDRELGLEDKNYDIGKQLLIDMVKSGAADKDQLNDCSARFLNDWQLMVHFKNLVEVALAARRQLL